MSEVNQVPSTEGEKGERGKKKTDSTLAHLGGGRSIETTGEDRIKGGGVARKTLHDTTGGGVRINRQQNKERKHFREKPSRR